MTKSKWKALYIGRLIYYGMSMQEAIKIYKEGKDNHEYDDDPISQADDLITYMIADK